MTAKSVLMRPQNFSPRARAPTEEIRLIFKVIFTWKWSSNFWNKHKR